MTLRPTRRAVLSGAALLLAGCAEVPSTGPVKRVDNPNDSAAQREGIDVAPEPPADGASIDLVVGGFLQAMMSARDDYRVARAYLTKDMADRWDPHAGATIYEATNHKPTSTVATASLQAPIVGTIDGDGHYHPAHSQTLKHDFGMAQEAGQWRISHPPKGLLVSQYTFQRAWSTIPIYFLAADVDRLVPDIIHLPSLAATPDAALRAMAAGVPEHVKPALRTALPSEVRILGTTSVDAVGVVTVPLSASAAQLSEAQRRLLASQVSWTLSGFAAISRIRFTAGGSLLPLPEAAEDNTVSADLYADFIPLPTAVSPTVVAVVKGQMGRVNTSGQPFQIMPGALGKNARPKTGVSAVASTQFAMPGATVSDPGGVWRAVSADRRSLLSWREGSAQTDVIATGKHLLRPQILVDHSVMTFSTIDPTLIVVGPDGTRLSTVVDLGGRTVTSFSVSPDGIRVALVLTHGKKSGLGIGLLSRKDNVVHLGHIVDMPLSSSDANLSRITDVAWLSQTRLCLLGSAIKAGVTAPYEVIVDGSGATSMGPLSGTDVQSVVAVPMKTGTEAVVLTADGKLLRHEERFRWRQILQGASAVAMTA
ncbi:LpqB family beta-propeller domain-containing protein [Cutibacterium sp.]|uniref:LpqB family beta-propeller domain-containing protein n=1 Tax=Cutibacterium sp. TaxID=1912221 RepID=UPI0026DCFE20|nr:LpqB family beta-propeller domain-containing protein [Cutibacterium sp.]MDO4412090.1 LpqB family beta-propeller domain-containing protein [Cutibacterium sp.]